MKSENDYKRNPYIYQNSFNTFVSKNQDCLSVLLNGELLYPKCFYAKKTVSKMNIYSHNASLLLN